MTEQLEAVGNSLPAIPEQKFLSLLDLMELNKQRLIAERDECLAMTIIDKDTYKAVRERRIKEKKKRAKIQQQAKAMRKPYKSAQDLISNLEDEFVAIVEPGETHLEKIEGEWEEKEAREKAERERAEFARYNKRSNELHAMHVLADSEFFILGEKKIPIEFVKGLDDDLYEENVLKPFKAIFEVQEAERLRKEKEEREWQEKLRQQAFELERQRKEFEEQQRIFREQQLAAEKKQESSKIEEPVPVKELPQGSNPNEIQMTFVEAIKKYDINATLFARKYGFTDANLRRWARGTRTPSQQVFGELEIALHRLGEEYIKMGQELINVNLAK